jgi:hypothetical protein
MDLDFATDYSPEGLSADLRARAARDHVAYPHLARKYADWGVGVAKRQVWRFGTTLATRGEEVLVSPDRTRFYSARICTDVEIHAEDISY